MTLPQRDFRDPLQVLLNKEEETCKGCVNERRIKAFGSVYMICAFKIKKHGTRCDDYEETA